MGEQSDARASTSGRRAQVMDEPPHNNSFEDPGLPPHTPRLTDVDERAVQRTERQVTALFVVSVLGTILFLYTYFFVRLDQSIGTLRLQNLMLGLGVACAMLGIGTGIVQWARKLMPDHEVSEERHTIRSEQDRQDAHAIVETIADESGIKRRPLIRNTLLAALALSPLPAIVLFRDLDKNPNPDLLRHTLWKPKTRLVRDPEGTPIRLADVTQGSIFHVVPEDLHDSPEGTVNDEKAKAAAILIRLPQGELQLPSDREDWCLANQTIVAYSKICTHVGCPVALYEQHTHHLLCPCHQSTFDASEGAKVVFGPAVRPLPQLPLEVDDEGYIVAKSDFPEPPGPSYWERG